MRGIEGDEVAVGRRVVGEQVGGLAVVLRRALQADHLCRVSVRVGVRVRVRVRVRVSVRVRVNNRVRVSVRG